MVVLPVKPITLSVQLRLQKGFSSFFVCVFFRGWHSLNVCRTLSVLYICSRIGTPRSQKLAPSPILPLAQLWNPELPKILSVQPEVGESIVFHALPTATNAAWFLCLPVSLNRIFSQFSSNIMWDAACWASEAFTCGLMKFVSPRYDLLIDWAKRITHAIKHASRMN